MAGSGGSEWSFDHVTHTVQFAFQFVDEEFVEETKGEFVLEERIQGGMPRPYILLGRKEKEPRGRNWDCQ